MELQEQTNRVIKMLETLVRRTINPKWQFTKDGNAALYIQNGVQQLPKLFSSIQIDEERIVDYIVYQIYRNRDAIESGLWQYHWLFSKAAMDRYKKQFLEREAKAGVNYYINLWLEENEISRSDLLRIVAKSKPNPLRNMVYLESEESIKKRFHNTQNGFTLCQLSTTGWSPLSESCKKCEKWIDCGKLTAQKYPELMRLRKEAYGKQKN